MEGLGPLLTAEEFLTTNDGHTNERAPANVCERHKLGLEVRLKERKASAGSKAGGEACKKKP